VVARVERYAVISQTFFEHPFFGLGSEVFAPGLVVYDNQWLKLLVEGGLTGLFAMLLLTVTGFIGIAAGLRRATTVRQRDEVFVAGAIFAGILTSSFSIDLFLFAQITLIFFLSYGLLWSTYSIPTTVGTTEDHRSKAVPVRSAIARSP
jgi:O-antigen ligase